jgi:DNA (cytosine-5)-methyltransferase 1
MSFTFIDLFAGIGGFHEAAKKSNGTCVFASEWDQAAAKVYADNHKMIVHGDITKPETKNAIPDHFDFLFAGFPCQPFSKSGKQAGFQDTRGTLFYDICEIILKHKPKFVLLENVANLVSHDKGNTYTTIIDKLQQLGYATPHEPLILSSHAFGIPMLRSRVYIPCVLTSDTSTITWNLDKFKTKSVVIDDYLIKDLDDESLNLSRAEIALLELWDEFYQGVRANDRVIGFPIWSDHFNDDPLDKDLPDWKQNFIWRNQHLYRRNKPFIDKWLKKHHNLEHLTPTHRKFEWQCGDKCESVFDGLIQFRTSGVRVKKPDKFSTLVAMNHQQIIGKLRRRLSVQESKLLQSFPEDFTLDDSATSLKQLGNSVNVKVVSCLIQAMREQT